MQVGLNATESILLSSADRQSLYAGAKALGVGLVRVEATWAVIEAHKGVYDWSAMDAIVADAAAAGVELLVVLGVHPPTWTRTAADFGAFVAEVVQHCGGVAYEVWNEQNSGTFWSLTAADYVAYLQAAAVPVRAAGGIVVFGGLAPLINFLGETDPATFLTACYKAGAKGSFDKLGYHPYSWSASSPSVGVFTKLDGVYAVVVANGDTAQVWCTELGFSTASLTQEQQRDFLAVQYAQAGSRSYIERFYPYAAKDYSFGKPHDDTVAAQNFGVVDSAGVPKLSGVWVSSLFGVGADWQVVMNELLGT